MSEPTGESVSPRYWRRWTKRPQHIDMTEAEKQQVYALAHALPEHIYGPIGVHPKCRICNPTAAASGGTDQ